jgi:hypothetical protein
MVTLSPQSSSERWNGKVGNVEACGGERLRRVRLPRWQKQPPEQNSGVEPIIVGASVDHRRVELDHRLNG